MSEPGRFRFTYSKGDPMRFTGHLDLQRAWERMLRRAAVPVVYTQGFNPRPRMSLGLALPLGFTSECELIDVWIEGEHTSEDLLQALRSAAPPGLAPQDLQIVGANELALQKRVSAATYLVHVPVAADLESRVRNLLGETEIERQRRGKRYDLRPLIETLEARPANGSGQVLVMRLSAREGATGRPEEVLHSLDLDPLVARIHRSKIHLD